MSARVPTLLRGVHVLIVDDEAEGLEVFRRVLEYSGALVTARSSARAALKAMERVRPNVVIENLHTLDAHAFWLIRTIRSLPGGGMPAVAVGESRAAADRRRTLAEGFQVYLAKPVHAEDLRRAVLAAVKGRGPAGGGDVTARRGAPGGRRGRRAPTDRPAS